MTGYPWRPFFLALVFCAVAGWLDAIGSSWWVWPLYAAIWAYGAWRYQCGRFFEARRGTCQENVEPVAEQQADDDRLYLDLKGARERLCRAQTGLNPTDANILQGGIDRIDLVACDLPQWSRHDGGRHG